MFNFFTVDFTLLFILIYVLLDTLNILWKKNDYKKGKILYLHQYDTIFIQYKFLKTNIIDFLINYNVYMLIVYFRLLLSILILFNLCSPKCIVLIFFIQVFLHIRNESLLNLADKFVINILLGLSFYYIFFYSEIIKLSSVFFIATLTIIAYFFTAFFKISGETWRKGVAIEQILSTDLYGNEVYFKFLIKHKLVSRFFNYFTILFQLLAPLTILSSKFALIYFAIGFTFHLMVAILMNLNNFFWVFISTYPCIYLMSIQIENYLYK